MTSCGAWRLRSGAFGFIRQFRFQAAGFGAYLGVYRAQRVEAFSALSPTSNKMRNALSPKPWVLPPLRNSWRISIIWLYIALTRTPNIDCYWVGAVPNLNPLGCRRIPWG